MILTCPQCDTQYRLAAQILGREGKNVKCTVCSETWFQYPDDSELTPATDDADFDAMMNAKPDVDIPQGVRPIPEEEDDFKKRIPSAEEKEEQKKPGMVSGLVAAGVVGCLIMGSLLGLQKPIVKSYPPANAFYTLLGFEEYVPGEGLIFDRLTVQNENGVYKITGNIINLTSDNKTIPMIEVSLRGKEQDVLETWMVKPPQNTINKEETLPFEAEYEAQSKSAHDLFLRFVIKP